MDIQGISGVGRKLLLLLLLPLHGFGGFLKDFFFHWEPCCGGVRYRGQRGGDWGQALIPAALTLLIRD